MKRVLLFLSLIPTFFSLTACDNPIYHHVNKINDYIFETDVYSSLDYDYADKYFEKYYDNWGGGCSAVSTIFDDEIYVGRNMDLNISNKCSYIVRTKASRPDEYDTIGLAYTFRDVSPDYNEVLAHDGIDDNWYKILPFMCDDVLNKSGLHIEINMRHAEHYPNGDDMFSCQLTNSDPEARRIYMFEVPRYIGSHCETVEEAVDYLRNNLNIYNKPGYWNYAYIISDAQKHSSLIEIAAGKIYETKQDDNNRVIQTNYYQTEELNEIEDIKTGEGRFNFLKDNIGSVDNQIALFDLMEYINYFQYYSSNCKFDRRSEVIGEMGFLTYDYVYNHIRQSEFQDLIDALFGSVAGLTRQQLRNENFYWETTFTEVVDIKNKTIKVKIFEKIQKDDQDPTYLKIDFDSTEIKADKEDLFE